MASRRAEKQLFGHKSFAAHGGRSRAEATDGVKRRGPDEGSYAREVKDASNPRNKAAACRSPWMGAGHSRCNWQERLAKKERKTRKKQERFRHRLMTRQKEAGRTTRRSFPRRRIYACASYSQLQTPRGFFSSGQSGPGTLWRKRLAAGE